MNNRKYKRQNFNDDFAMALLRKTEGRDIYWISFERIIQHLDEECISLNNIYGIYSYLIFQQNNRYIPNLRKRTYICYYEEHLIILSEGKYSAQMRLAFMNTSSHKKKWELAITSQVTLVRLRDAIELFALCDTREDCQELLYSMGDIPV